MAKLDAEQMIFDKLRTKNTEDLRKLALDHSFSWTMRKIAYAIIKARDIGEKQICATCLMAKCLCAFFADGNTVFKPVPLTEAAQRLSLARHIKQEVGRKGRKGR